jgi:spore coat protein A
MTIIGSDGGLLEAPDTRSGIAIFNGERFDVVIDFSRYPVGSSVVLHNTRAMDPGLVFPDLLPDIMRFDIVRDESDPSDVPPKLASVERLRPEDAVRTRRFVLDFTNGHWTINGLTYDPARIDADPRLGTTEIWEFENRSDHTHDMHLHLVQFQHLIGPTGGPPDPHRSGWKDTKRSIPNVVESIIVPFEGYAGVYVFHCHMLEHAEHMMMGQFEVLGPEGSTDPVKRRELTELGPFAAFLQQPGSSFYCGTPTSGT